MPISIAVSGHFAPSRFAPNSKYIYIYIYINKLGVVFYPNAKLYKQTKSNFSWSFNMVISFHYNKQHYY